MYRKVKTAMAVFGCVTAALILSIHSVSASAADGSTSPPVAEEIQDIESGGAARDPGMEESGTGSGTEEKTSGSGTEEKASGSGTEEKAANSGTEEKPRKAEELLGEIDWDEMAAANVNSYVNVRKKASTKSDIVGILQKGHAVKVVGTKGSWTKITSGKIKGYIKSKYLVFGKKARKKYMKNVGVTGTVTAKSLTIREKASKKADRLGSVKKGGQVTIVSIKDNWYKISYKKSSGYVAAKYITADKLQGAITVKAYRKMQKEEYGCSKGELDMLAAIIECEAGGEKRVGKVAVGAVVLNRVRSKRFPNTIARVIKQKGQFSPVGSGKFSRVLARGARKDCYEAARAALKGENPVGNALFFSAGRGKGRQIGNQHFY
ncbi:MAG TPA: hypothetical protein DF613_03310 [Lachnospiraceae bacterium]|nr:hypothetical protein [Lachnospiraceae bacterium]